MSKLALRHCSSDTSPENAVCRKEIVNVIFLLCMQLEQVLVQFTNCLQMLKDF